MEAQPAKAGIPLIAQWGCYGCWIDYAARHSPGRAGWSSPSNTTVSPTTPRPPPETATASAKSAWSGSAGGSTAFGPPNGSTIASLESSVK